MNYLILYHNFNIINLTQLININNSLESYNTYYIKDLDILKSNYYGFSYIVNKFYENHKKFLTNEGSFLLYHLDRQYVQISNAVQMLYV